MTPEPYFHIGGDEVKKLTPDQYRAFIERVQDDRRDARQGDDRVGRDRTGDAAADDHRPALAARGVDTSRPRRARSDPVAGAEELSRHEVRQDDTVLGLNWAGDIDVRTAYDWDPARARWGASRAHPRHRGAVLDRDACDDGRPRVHGVSASGCAGGDRLVATPIKTVGRVQSTTGGPRAPLVGIGHQLLSLAPDCLARGALGERLSI